MLDEAQLNIAIEMQERSYKLLKWLADAVKRGFIRFDAAHEFASFSEAAEAWLREHYLNIPEQSRVARQLLPEFACFFSTYLENSFDIIEAPGMRLHSPYGHCFCPLCSWLVVSPNLKAKKPVKRDKIHARKLRLSIIKHYAKKMQMHLDDAVVQSIIDDKEWIEATAYTAYGHDLIKRMRGIATGPAVLVLWRNFAWTKEGSPKKRFKLEAAAILEAERRVCECVRDRSAA